MPEYKLQRLGRGWATAVYVDGKRIHRHRLAGTDTASAAREHEAYVASLDRPIDQTVRECWTKYVKEMEGRAVVGTMVHTAKPILPFFGDMKPADITVENCRAYVKSRKGIGRKDGTIHTELGHLRMVLLWAKKRRMIHEVPHVERPHKPAPVERHLTRHQFARLLDGASDVWHIQLFCHLALASAGRANALLDLQWDRVDFGRSLVFLGLPNAIRPQKGRATVPMTDTLRAVLQTAREHARSPYVIEYAGEKVGSVKKGLAAAGRRAGIGHVSPHVLRHTSAIWMLEAGVPIQEVSQYLGHKDVATTARVYALYTPDYLRRAAGALEINAKPRLIRPGS